MGVWRGWNLVEVTVEEEGRPIVVCLDHGVPPKPLAIELPGRSGRSLGHGVRVIQRQKAKLERVLPTREQGEES